MSKRAYRINQLGYAQTHASSSHLPFIDTLNARLLRGNYMQSSMETSGCLVHVRARVSSKWEGSMQVAAAVDFLDPVIILGRGLENS